MPKMSSKDATFHVAQDLIYSLQNPAPESALVKLVNEHKEALRNLAEIFGKDSPSSVPLMVPVREVVQYKLKEVNQEISQIKI